MVLEKGRQQVMSPETKMKQKIGSLWRTGLCEPPTR